MAEYLYSQDTSFVRDNLIFNYCLGDDGELLIDSFIRNNGIEIRFNKDDFYMAAVADRDQRR